jgi:GT2 family glycosyltransferase
VRHYLEQCLHAALAALEGIEGEVIVVDNASADDSSERVRQVFGEQVILIESPENLGFSRANNLGIRQARGRYVLLLNPDTVVAEDTFRNCLRFADAHPDAGGIGVHMIDGQGNFLPESKRSLPTPWVSFYKIFGLAALFPRSRRFGQYHLSFLDRDENHAVEILSGAFMWMRKDLLDHIGGLDETFFMYGEDIDLSYRILQAGYRNYYLGRELILHYKGESTRKDSVRYVRVFYEAMIIFAQKHFGGNDQRAFIAAIRLAVYFRASLALLRRAVRWAWFPLLEAGLIYSLLYGIKEYWEHYVKYIEGGAYPPIFAAVYLPVYTLIFWGFLKAMGAYRRPFRIQPLLFAPALGFIAIATGTYMFSSWVQNFSRAIVGLSSVFTFLVGLLLRGLINRRERGDFFFTDTPQTQMLLVGSSEGCRELEAILRRQRLHARVAGHLCPEAGSPERLGDPSQLAAAARMLRIDDIIFHTPSLGRGAALALMKPLGRHSVRQWFYPGYGPLLLGSHRIELLDASEGQQAFPLSQQQHLKRRLDRVLAALLLLSLLPGLPFLQRRRGIASRLTAVLRGRRALVGYIGSGPAGAPPLPEPLLTLCDAYPAAAGLDPEALDRHYARNWTGWQDLGILLRAYPKL